MNPVFYCSTGTTYKQTKKSAFKTFFWNSNAQVSLKRNYAQVWNLFYKNIINSPLEKDRHTIFLLTL